MSQSPIMEITNDKMLMKKNYVSSRLSEMLH